MSMITINEPHQGGDVNVTCEKLTANLAVHQAFVFDGSLDDPAAQLESMRFDPHRWIMVHIATATAVMVLCEHDRNGDDVTIDLAPVRAFAEWLEGIGDWSVTNADDLPEPNDNERLLLTMFHDRPSSWPVPKPAAGPSGDDLASLMSMLAEAGVDVTGASEL